MTVDERLWIGADPGGKKNFGIAIIFPGGTAQTWCVNCADEAVDLIKTHLNAKVGGVGVDAPMWWSSGPSGDRRADQWLRKTYRLSGGEVQATNSLRGAALVQGLMFVQRIRESIPAAPVTEAHPNAVLKALGTDADAFCKRFAVTMTVANKHERDAVISAVAAREGFCGRWTRDLSKDRHPGEQDPASYWMSPIHYFWPE